MLVRWGLPACFQYATAEAPNTHCLYSIAYTEPTVIRFALFYYEKTAAMIKWHVQNVEG